MLVFESAAEPGTALQSFPDIYRGPICCREALSYQSYRARKRCHSSEVRVAGRDFNSVSPRCGVLMLRCRVGFPGVHGGALRRQGSGVPGGCAVGGKGLSGVCGCAVGGKGSQGGTWGCDVGVRFSGWLCCASVARSAGISTAAAWQGLRCPRRCV